MKKRKNSITKKVTKHELSYIATLADGSTITGAIKGITEKDAAEIAKDLKLVRIEQKIKKVK